MSRWFPDRAADRPYFCVVGSPVAHSLSPRIHAAFAAQTGRDLAYDRIEVGRGELAAAVDEFRRVGGVGMNVTVPLKEEALMIADRRLDRAAAAGAANTLWFDAGGETVCDNTDGTGLQRDLEINHGVRLRGLRVLLIGAGGAARGVTPALTAAVPASLTVTNRTAEKAQAIASDFGRSVPIHVLPWGAAPAAPFDLVIQATSLGLQGRLPPVTAALLHAHTVVYDMMYGPGAGIFAGWARQAGAARALDGLGMLVEQAAEAYLIWHGVRPDTAAVLTDLRRSLATASD